MFEKIILNIPHSSTRFFEGVEKWDNQEELQKCLYKWTDWETDKIFRPSQTNDNIIVHRFEYSRFCVDVERLMDDPLTEIGQGILYTRFDNMKRNLSEYSILKLMGLYWTYIDGISSTIGPNDIVIDCHSFPDMNNEYADICIGFNEDFSQPSDECIKSIVSIFMEHGFSVTLNIPYSNSITPKNSKDYKSIMIELNKRIYLNGNELRSDAYKVASALNRIYKTLLSESTTAKC